MFAYLLLSCLYSAALSFFATISNQSKCAIAVQLLTHEYWTGLIIYPQMTMLFAFFIVAIRMVAWAYSANEAAPQYPFNNAMGDPHDHDSFASV